MAPTTKTQMVSIPLEEYKELLLRESPGETKNVILGRILESLPNYLKYEENHYASGYVDDYLRAEHGNGFITEVVRIIKYTDFELYMQIWNGIMTGERKRNAMEEQIEQMRKAKEIRENNA